jgi:hypothetical protein
MRGRVLVETTHVREAYYGVVLNAKANAASTVERSMMKTPETVNKHLAAVNALRERIAAERAKLEAKFKPLVEAFEALKHLKLAGESTGRRQLKLSDRTTVDNKVLALTVEAAGRSGRWQVKEDGKLTVNDEVVDNAYFLNSFYRFVAEVTEPDR